MKLISQYGQSDGIRWGDVGWGNHRRRYQYDRLTGAVRLFVIDGRTHCGSPSAVTEDRSQERAAAVRALIERAGN
jgi:hypothetical protein